MVTGLISDKRFQVAAGLNDGISQNPVWVIR
jgi:hypothetical protein